MNLVLQFVVYVLIGVTVTLWLRLARIEARVAKLETNASFQVK